MNNQFELFKTKRFWPIFCTQFCGAFNDNVYKATVSVLIAYGVVQSNTMTPEVLVTLATAAFIIPFVICAPFAGIVADAKDKSLIIRILKWAELLIVALAFLGFVFKSIPVFICVLILFGMQSAFFAPCKFGILPHHLDDNEMIGANGLINTATYLAIITGTICGSLFIGNVSGVTGVIIILAVVAVFGLYASHQIPSAPPIEQSNKPSFAETVREVINIFKTNEHGLFKVCMASGWFFFSAAILLAQFPNVTGRILYADQTTLAVFFSICAFGMAVGGLMNNKLLKQKISLSFVWVSALASAIFAADLFYALTSYDAFFSSELQTLSIFLSKFSGWRIMIDAFILSLCGGLYIVPIKTHIQHYAPAKHRGKIVSANAMFDALFIIVSSLLSALLLSLGATVPHLFLLTAVGFGCFGVALYTGKTKH